jgi:hypothetical protein
MEFYNDSIRTHIEFWFIPIDILMILCTGFVVLIASVYLSIIILDKTSRSVSTMLLCNSFLSEILFASVMLSMAVFTFQNDIRQIKYEDSLCIFRAYMSYALSAVRSHSYLLQSIYRYISIIYPSNLFYQSARFQFYLICLTWLFSLIHPFLFTNQIKYNVENQVCHMPYQSSFFIFYTCFLAYLNPITIIIIIYFKLVRYVQKMNKLVTPVNQLLRIQRELKMVRRIIMLLIILIALGLPYTIFFFMSFFTNPPKYHFRWAFLSVDVSLLSIIIALGQFSDPLNTFVIRIINQWTNKSISI